MNSNSVVIVDREMAAAQIEGVDFGSKLWIIARSPAAVLAWVYGHSTSINGHRRYYEPHLLILPDRTHRFMSRPHYIAPRYNWQRLTVKNLVDAHNQIVDHFGKEALKMIEYAVWHRKTAIIEGGGGRLMPHPKLWGKDYSDWIKNPENGFLSRAEVDEGLKVKLGYREMMRD